MDDTSTTFSKKNGLMVNRHTAVLIIIIFVGCLVATGLIVYNFTSTCIHPNTTCNAISAEVSTCNILTTELLITSTEQLPTETSTPIQEVVTSTVEKKLNVRLPKSVFPEAYEIRIIPFIVDGNFTFHGEVRILVNVSEDTSNITLHFDDIIVDYSSLHVNEVSESIRNIPIVEITNDTSRQFLIIHLGELLKQDELYTIYIKYTGVLNDILQGFYRSSYTVNNQTRYCPVLIPLSTYLLTSGCIADGSQRHSSSRQMREERSHVSMSQP